MKEIFLSLTYALEEALPPDVPVSSLLLLLFCLCVFLLGCTGVLALRWNKLKSEAEKNRRKISTLSAELGELRIRETQLSTLLTSERKHGSEKLRLLDDARRELSMQFENLAAQIFEEKSARFSELNKEKIEAIITPFSKELSGLKQEINEIYRSDSRERTSLKSEIIQLKELNIRINHEAVNLTRALTNDTKTQGNWGELVLERILECSGLQKDREYRTQSSFRSTDNQLLIPDVIVSLPEGKDIVVDSKVSLKSWERYVNSETEEQRRLHLTRLVTSIREHIRGLSKKNYPGLRGLHSLDFVLMFMPIEGAFAAACKADETIVTEALAKNIIIVTPTTLLATLRTVENIWKFDRQSKNSVEIARRAGLMYDKFRGFIEELEKLGKQLSNCHNSYEGALLKLARGRGNLVSQAEQLRELGVQVKTELPQSITEIAELELNS